MREGDEQRAHDGARATASRSTTRDGILAGRRSSSRCASRRSRPSSRPRARCWTRSRSASPTRRARSPPATTAASWRSPSPLPPGDADAEAEDPRRAGGGRHGRGVRRRRSARDQRRQRGRVRVRFPWDQRPTPTATPSSRWIRVSQYWAGGLRRALHAARRARGAGGLHAGRPRPARHRRPRLQRAAPSALRREAGADQEHGQEPERRGEEGGRRVQRDPLRGQGEARADLPPRAAEPRRGGARQPLDERGRGPVQRRQRQPEERRGRRAHAHRRRRRARDGGARPDDALQAERAPHRQRLPRHAHPRERAARGRASTARRRLGATTTAR